jgi:hypothetical protein
VKVATPATKERSVSAIIRTTYSQAMATMYKGGRPRGAVDNTA